MIARLFSMGLYGLEAFTVEVEADLAKGVPCFDIVGLPGTAVKESRERVRSALKNCGFAYPTGRITMNLAPADKKKDGPLYDLPLLMALLKATGQLQAETDDSVFIGELSLSGEIRPVLGALPMAIASSRGGYVPLSAVAEVSVEQAPQSINRSNQSRVVTITGDTSSGNTTAKVTRNGVTETVSTDFEKRC